MAAHCRVPDSGYDSELKVKLVKPNSMIFLFFNVKQLGCKHVERR